MNLVTRNLAQLLAAVSVVFSLGAFAQHVSINNIAFLLTSIAASINFGRARGLNPVCGSNAFIPATVAR